MPALNRVMADRELQRLIQLYLKAETDIINEIGCLRSFGLVDYHAEAALDRVQAILRKLESDSWEYVPQMIERQFYVNHPEARKASARSETPEKHERGYLNASALTGEEMDIVQRLTMNLMGELTEANTTAYSTLANALIGRTEPDIFRRVGLEQTAAVQATGRGVFWAVPDFVKALRQEGVTAFVDKAGRKWSLHTYASMVLCTTSRQAEVLSVLTQDQEWDLYKISKHGTTCRLCAPFEGRVYSRSGRDPDFPPLAAAFGKMDPGGPDTLENSWLNIHPNCLHQLIRWTPMGRSDEEIQKIKDFSSFKKNPPTRDPRTQKQIDAYRKKEQGRAKWLANYRQWERYRETLGDGVPKTFETFLKHKAAGDDKFKAWSKSYRTERRLAKSDNRSILKSGGISGALEPSSDRAQDHAVRYYESVRKMTTDVARIAKNTGYSEHEVQRIKNFIFLDAHDLGDGRISRFDPSYEMAESWQRLIDGKDIKPHDLTLLRHEIAERSLMEQGYSQDEAHRIASAQFNYRIESEAYYGNLGQH